MIFCLNHLLTTETLTLLNQQLDNSEFVDGKTTAGWHARPNKNNQQLHPQTAGITDLKELIGQAIQNHPLVQMAIFPKFIHSILFSRYGPSMGYGTHVDNAVMGQGPLYRSDVSFSF